MKGKNTYLRALEPNDVDWLYRWENEVSLWHLSGTMIPFSRETLRKYADSVTDIYTDRQLRLIICRQSDHGPVGCIDLFDFDPVNCRAGVGILIADSSNRRKGYANEALEILLKHCRDFLHLHQVFANILSNNAPSIALFEKSGFRVCGLKQEWVRTTDGWQDELLLQRILI